MFQKIAKHRANDASLTMHRPPLTPTPSKTFYTWMRGRSWPFCRCCSVAPRRSSSTDPERFFGWIRHKISFDIYQFGRNLSYRHLSLFLLNQSLTKDHQGTKVGHTSTASEVRNVKFKTVKTVHAVCASHTRYRIGTEIKHGSHKRRHIPSWEYHLHISLNWTRMIT